MGIHVYMYIHVWTIMVRNKMIIHVIVYFKRYININVQK